MAIENIKAYKSLYGIVQNSTHKTNIVYDKNGFLKTVSEYYIFLKKVKHDLLTLTKRDINVFFEKFSKFTDTMVSVAYSLESGMSVESRKIAREAFRELFGKYIFESKIIKRFYEKPFGYPGDHLMFEMIYDGVTLSNGIGFFFDKYILNYFLIKSVINRKNLMKCLLKQAANNNFRQRIKILNIGCGSCREIKEFINEDEKLSILRKLDITLLDQDNRSLRYAKNNILLQNKEIKFNYIESDVLSLINFKKNPFSATGNRWDLIYSMGLVDYFRDNTLLRFIENFLGLLKPGGKLILAVCSSYKAECYAALRWFCEWNFNIRDAYETLKFIKKAMPSNSININWENNKQIFFLSIKR